MVVRLDGVVLRGCYGDVLVALRKCYGGINGAREMKGAGGV